MKLLIILLFLMFTGCATKKVMKNCSEFKHDADSLFVCEKF